MKLSAIIKNMVWAFPKGDSRRGDVVTVGERVEMLEEFIEDIEKDWDCDADSHKYGTACRCCEAAKVLKICESEI